MKFKSPNTFWILVFCLSLLIGIGIRFYCGLKTNLWEDEVISYLTAKNVSYNDIFLSTGDYHDLVHPPLYYIVLKTCLLLGDNDQWLRLTSLAWFFPSLVLVFLIAKVDNKNKINSLIALSLFLLHPLLSNLAFQVRPYPMAIFFMLLSVYLLLRQFKKTSLKGQLLTGLSLAISFYTDYATIWLLAGILMFGIISLLKGKKTVTKTTLWILMFFTLFSIYQIGILTNTMLSKEPEAKPGSVPSISIEGITKETNILTGIGSIIPSLFLLVVVIAAFKNKKTNKILKNEFFLTILISSIYLSIFYSLIDKPIFLARNLVISSLCLVFLIPELKSKLKLFFIVSVVLIYGYNTTNRYEFLYEAEAESIIRSAITNDSILLSFPDQKIPHYLEYYLEKEGKSPNILSFSNEDDKAWLDNQQNIVIFLVNNCYNRCTQQQDEARRRFCSKNICNEYFNW